MLSKEVRQLKKVPIKILLCFLILTELLVWIGPIDYNINTLLLAPYLCILNLALWYGYKLGVKTFVPTCYKISPKNVHIIIICGFFLTLLSLTNLWNSHGIPISLESLINAFINPGEAYYSEADEVTQTNFFSLILSPLQWAAIPMGIYFWSNLTKSYKAIVIITILVSIFAWLGIGTRKGIFDIVLVVVSCVSAANSHILIQPKNRKKLIWSVVTFTLAFLSYFIFSNLSRYGKNSFEELADLGSLNIKPTYCDAIGLPLTVAFSFITGYLCQGYYALGKGLELGILSPALFGSSWFGIAVAKKLGFDPTPYTYTKILESQGIDMSVNWHSLYLWLANEYTFIFVPFIIFIIGYILAKTWCDSLYKHNPLVYPLMSLMVIMVFYAFANNQVFSFSFIPFYFWFFCYKIFSRKIK